MTASTAVALEELFEMPELEHDSVAKVGAHTVSAKELEQELRQMMIQLTATGLPPQISREQVLRGALERIVDRVIFTELARVLDADPDPKFEERWLADLTKRMEAQPSFKAFLLRAGKDEAQRRRDAENAAIRDAVVAKIRERVKGDTEMEARKYYERHQGDFKERAGVEAWRIYVKAPRGMVQRDRDIARGRAEGILAKARANPGNFENIAISNSEGGKAHTGGFVGWVSKGTLAPELEAQVFAAKAGSILPLWEDASGFYVYKVGRSRQARVRTFAEVAPEILAKVYRATINSKIESELKRLRASTDVQFLVPELETP